MMELVGHAALYAILHNSKSSVLEECHKLIIRSHDAIVWFIKKECSTVDVLFYEDEASLAAAFIPR